MTLKQFVKNVGGEKDYNNWNVHLWIMDGELYATARSVKDVKVEKRRFIFWKKIEMKQNAREITSIIK